MSVIPDFAPLSAGGSLYRPEYEHDACGVGFVADIAGRPSHSILQKAVESVVNLTHRGAIAADGRSGDGAGVLTQLPRKLLLRELTRMGVTDVAAEDLAAGMMFLPRESENGAVCARTITEAAIARQGLRCLGWREVPVDAEALGAGAAATQPRIEQVLIARPAGLEESDFERALYLARKEIECRAEEEGLDTFYVPSLSCRTLVYKGLLVAPQLARFYPDLRDPDYDTALAVYHQRYSTNTFPNWFLAQPFRRLAHNGEINTLQGNQNWIRAREPELASEVWGERIRELVPVIQAGGSDSAKLDNVLELLENSGRDILHSMMMLVPEPWENMPHMDRAWRDFYEYHASLQEPWDGPAALAFSDGVIVGATLDRNGLRPARYKITRQGVVVMGSEVGATEIDDGDIVEKGRLGPGQMIAVDTRAGRLLTNVDIKGEVAARQPYGKWVRAQMLHLDDLLADGERKIEDDGNGSAPHPAPSHLPAVPVDLLERQKAFGYTHEDLTMIVQPMIEEAKEPVYSMGDDTPLAVLGRKPRLLYSYFRQKFAQVTNPPIDHLREELVMSLNCYLGQRRSLLQETPEHAHLLHLARPVLRDHELERIWEIDDPSFQPVTIPAVFPAAEGVAGLERGVARMCAAAAEAVDAGRTVLVLSDRGVDAQHAPVPMLLAVGAVHHHLIRAGKRMRVDLIAETGEAWDVHQTALLIGYGAGAVNPYLALATLCELVESGEVTGLSADEAIHNYLHALDHGLLKIISKMGISTITSYRGAQIFEAIGLAREVVDRYFTDTPSPVGGIGLEQIAEDVLHRHVEAFGDGSPARLNDYGLFRYRRDGEYHAFNPQIVKTLHQAMKSGDYKSYRAFSEMVNAREPTAIRDLLRFKSDRSPVPLDEVEPVEDIRKRFTTTAMSLGALSPEAHETLAIAMNRMGAKSNTGEGGEDPTWFYPKPNGDWSNSAIKQVASGRFGVTPEYLANAIQLEIKMAQGSKPGEGGQLPGHKVSPYIARIRHAVPGIPLISPPPHHDIYSIEDLAQLIYDLKQANPRARVGVKLVAESGVGTIAAGVAKAYADVILISGHDGGTGASPLSSIKHAGVPWEIGLAETQQVLVLNNLRGRVLLRTDGGLKTARDVVVAAMLGAEEYGFGTAAVVAIGCKMARQCHLNTCPVGVATQREDLRAKFDGTPEMAVTFFTHLAAEVREILAELGYRSVQELIGRSDLLEQVSDAGNPRANLLDLGALLAQVDPSGERPRFRVQERNNRPGVPLDDAILVDVRPALEDKTPVRLEYAVHNTDRTLATKIAGEIAHRFGDAGLPEGTVEIKFNGSAGQSFGAFNIRGLRLILTGEANDYVGKGMHGGEIVLRPPDGASFAGHENTIMGNTVLYGATGGSLFAAGRAGERFAVRNSGARAVVEGVGDHGCEYMTGGIVVVLGPTGRNFGAGMTNGIAFVLDEGRDLGKKLNTELVTKARVHAAKDVQLLKSMIIRHYHLTGSHRARTILAEWNKYLPLFWQVLPYAPTSKVKASEALEVGFDEPEVAASGR
jgi:glutamate synthase (NADPH/NADH) large chain/glutamate synthase (ferredoxin)